MKSTKLVKDFDYSATTARLEDIIARLQSNETDIESSLVLYEEGMLLLRQLETYLKVAEHRITTLTTKP